MNSEMMKIVLLCILAGAAAGALAAYAMGGALHANDEHARFAEYYATETAVSVSPADYTAELDSGRNASILVDLRSSAEYQASHFRSAISIPAVEMNTAQLVDAFSKLSKDKTVVTYCYSSYCMLSRQVGDALAKHGIYVKHMTAGWYELNRDYSQYTVNGTGSGQIGGSCAYTPGGEFHC